MDKCFCHVIKEKDELTIPYVIVGGNTLYIICDCLSTEDVPK